MKEAVVLILDGNHSMSKKIVASVNNEKEISPEDDGNKNNTKKKKSTKSNISRFDCAKQVAHDLISDLMIQSKQNEVVIVVLKTTRTNHHLYDDNDEDEDDEDSNETIPYKNITEIGGSGDGHGLCRPTCDLLRKIAKLHPQTKKKDDRDSDSLLRGDFVDGIIVGADALQKRTANKRFKRRIILLTDAEHKIAQVGSELFQVIDGLRDMECQLEVIGFDFQSQGEYEHKAIVAAGKGGPTNTSTDNGGGGEENQDTDVDDSENDDDDREGSETDTSDEEDEDDDSFDEEDLARLIKQQNEPLLLSLTEKTGGYVMSAKEMQPILSKILGHRTTKSVKRKIEFHIAPGLQVEARFYYMFSKKSIPTLKKTVVTMDDGNDNNDFDDENENDDDDEPIMTQSQGQSQRQKQLPKPKLNSLGEEMTSDYTIIDSYWDPEEDQREIIDTAKAYRYGSDLIPMGGLDMSGLINPSPRKIQILGYMPETTVPLEVRIGPPYILSGGESRKSCAAISALAQGLAKLKHVAIATMVKSTDSDPILIGLFPWIAPSTKTKDNSKTQSPRPPIHLLIMQLPFEGDIPTLPHKLLMTSSQTAADEDSDDTNKSKKESSTSIKQRKMCDDLIDSLMLPGDKLDSMKIPNPYIRSFHKTVIQRVLDPKSPIVSVRGGGDNRKAPGATKNNSEDGKVDGTDDIKDGSSIENNNDDDDDDENEDPMSTPSSMLKEAQPCIDAFRKTFPITIKSQDDLWAMSNKTGKGRKRRPVTYRDFVADSDSDDDDGDEKEASKDSSAKQEVAK